MVAVTETHPRGPAILVDRWGDAIVACAWQALLDVADGIAAGTGRDIDGRPLRAGALVATDDGLTVHPQAPHAFERAPAATAAEAPHQVEQGPTSAEAPGGPRPRPRSPMPSSTSRSPPAS
jgi:hypothetical protein